MLFYTHCSSTERETPDQVGVGEGSLRVLNIDNQHSAGNQGRAGNLYTRGAAFGRVSGLPRWSARPPCRPGPSACRRGRLGCRSRPPAGSRVRPVSEGHHASCAWLHARVAVDRDFRG